MPCGERLDDLIEESRWQEAVVITITAADFPEIVSRPIEFVALGDNDPGTCVIKSEVTLDRGGNFDGGRGSAGGACVIGRTTTTVVSFAARSTASTITLGRSLRPSSRPASRSWCHR
jgi:hypothetical protein